jgi:hypothetical protein
MIHFILALAVSTLRSWGIRIHFTGKQLRSYLCEDKNTEFFLIYADKEIRRWLFLDGQCATIIQDSIYDIENVCFDRRRFDEDEGCRIHPMYDSLHCLIVPNYIDTKTGDWTLFSLDDKEIEFDSNLISDEELIERLRIK